MKWEKLKVGDQVYKLFKIYKQKKFDSKVKTLDRVNFGEKYWA